jgi:DNA uptake protein ComE-like DNA-binding protein
LPRSGARLPRSGARLPRVYLLPVASSGAEPPAAPPVAEEHDGDITHGWWLVAVSLIPLAGWVAATYAGSRAQVRRWTVTGVALLGCWIGAIAVTVSVPERDQGIGGGLIILAWVICLGAALVIRPGYRERMGGSLLAAKTSARERIETRTEAQQLAEQTPRLALEMGVGRPDKQGATDMGVIDINHASVAAIASLPRIDRSLAEKIAHARDEVDGFSSLDDMGAALELPAGTVEDLRDRVVFLPR